MRIARVTAPGAVYHVISRFVDQRWEFREDIERAKYLSLLGRALQSCDWRCLSYALMSSHIHLAMVAGEQPMWRWLKRVHSPFANWMNERHDRLGPLFAQRPNAWAVRPEHIGELIAYIHNNPVRAGVVAHARDSAWTSHAAYVGLTSAPRWLAVGEGLQRCGLTRDHFDAVVNGADVAPERVPLDGIHRAARKRGAVELATPTAKPTEVPLVARRFARVRPDPRLVVAALEDVIGIPASRIASRSNTATLRVARCLAVHSGLALGLTITEISTALGLSRQAGSRIAGRPLDDVGRAVVALVAARLTKVTPSPAKAAQVQDETAVRR